MKEISDALRKIADVHDRRLGEVAAAINRLADQFTHNDRFDVPLSGIDHIASEINNLSATLHDKLAELAQTPDDSE